MTKVFAKVASFAAVSAAVTAVAAGLAAGAAPHRPGVYPARGGLAPAEVVRTYVEAINRRDGTAFCGVVAAWISGGFDLWGNDPDAPLLEPTSCPDLVHGLIGYIEDCCPPKFVRYEIVRIGEPMADGELLRVPVDLRVHVEQDGKPRTMPLHDVVWLVRDRGAWRVAKLGMTAATASLAGGSGGDLVARPDVSAERRRFASEVAAFDRRQREREASYRPTLGSLRCTTSTTVRDPARDMADWIHPAPPTSIARVLRADLRSLAIGRSGSSLCVRFEVAGAIRGPSRFTFAIRDGPPARAFYQSFEVELRPDGRARVTSGVDEERRPVVVPAKVAVSSRRLTLLVDRESFARGKPAASSTGSPSLDSFGFGAAVYVRLSVRRETTDPLGTMPNDTFFTFPTGGRCANVCG